MSMHPVANVPGLYRTPRALAPGTHLVRVHGKRWRGAEAGVRLVWGEAVPRARILLEREE